MNCAETSGWLGSYLDGEAPRDVRQGVEAHLAICTTCADELDSLRRVVAHLAPRETHAVPHALWPAVTARLDSARDARPFGVLSQPQRGPVLFSLRRMASVAAVLLAAIGLGLFTLPWSGGANRAEAASINFAALLDAVRVDAPAAFDRFMRLYNAQEVTPAEAKRFGKNLNFAIPETLPGGFQRAAIYTLHFGPKPGVAARYARDGEMLCVLFHPPVLKEQFGTHEDRDCIVGKHRGHAVAVGDWSLVHMTDATTCHCVLSRLDEDRELPAVMAAVAPGANGHTGQSGAPPGRP